MVEAAGVEEHCDAGVQGVDADQRGLSGKPDPAVFLEAARRLGVEPLRGAAVEDAPAGVQAGCRGGVGLVIGLDRGGRARALRDGDTVGDLGEVRVLAAKESDR